jgi:amino acid transporter
MLSFAIKNIAKMDA